MERQVLQLPPQVALARSRRARGSRLLGGLVLGGILIAGAASAAMSDTGIRVLYQGRLFAGPEAGRHYCHDLTYPIIRCFDTPAETEADEAAIQSP